MFISKIHSCDNVLLEQQKQKLINEIISGQNKEYFKIYDIEAGCGKTRTAELGIAEKILLDKPNNNVLLVRRTNADCKESAENINNIIGKPVSFDFNNETVKRHEIASVQKTLFDIPVLIITHPMYRELAKNKERRKLFTQGRNTLIIDEFISDVQKLIITIDDIEKLKAFFKHDNIMYEHFLNIVEKLENFYKPSDIEDCQITVFTKDSIKKNILKLSRYIQNNFTNAYVKEHRLSLSSAEIETKNQLCAFIKEIYEFYSRLCYVRDKAFYTTDSRYNNWLLDNNILLDASGSLQVAYSMNEKLYKLVNFPKVLDHSNWKIRNIIVNTTKAGKDKITNFYDVVNKSLDKLGDDDTLVIGSKVDIGNINCKYSAYFGNITGSNEWSKLKNAIIVHTHNLDDVDYIMQFLHYSSDCVFPMSYGKITTKYVGRNVTSRYSFTAKRFEDIRCLWIAEQTYQALKRINRSMEHTSKVIIYMNNEDVINLLEDKLRGCDIKIITDYTLFTAKKTKQDNYIEELQSNSHATKFMSLMVELMNGEHEELIMKNSKKQVIYGSYAKKTLREYLGIKDSNTFNMCVLSKTEIINFCNVRDIKIENKLIRIPC